MADIEAGSQSCSKLGHKLRFEVLQVQYDLLHVLLGAGWLVSTVP